MRKLAAAAAVLSTAIFSLPADAATLEQVRGNVQVNRGHGFQPARNGAQITAGDIVVAGEGGSAVVSYSGACSLLVPAGSIHTVAGEPSCAHGHGHSHGAAAGGGGYAGGGVGVGSAGAGGIGATALIGGGLVAAGTGLAIYQQSRNSRGNRRPTSP